MPLSSATVDPHRRQPSRLFAFLSSLRQSLFSRPPKKSFFLGPGNRFRGFVDDVDLALVHGRLQGSVVCRDLVHIFSEGAVQGDIHARVVLVEGAVGGNITVSKRVEIKPNARVCGDIFSPKVSLAQGAYFQGRIEMPLDKRPVLLRLAKGCREACKTFFTPRYRPIHLSLLITALLLGGATLLLQPPAQTHRSPVVVPAVTSPPAGVSPPPESATAPAVIMQQPSATVALRQTPEAQRPVAGNMQREKTPAGETAKSHGQKSEPAASAVAAPESSAVPRRDEPITREEAERFLQQWKKATEKAAGPSGAVQNYFSLYTKNFALDTVGRSFWQVEKSKILRKKKWVAVAVQIQKIEPSTTIPGGVNLFFRQEYSSSNYSDKTDKRILLIREDGVVRIQEEEERRVVE